MCWFSNEEIICDFELASLLIRKRQTYRWHCGSLSVPAVYILYIFWNVNQYFVFFCCREPSHTHRRMLTLLDVAAEGHSYLCHCCSPWTWNTKWHLSSLPLPSLSSKSLSWSPLPFHIHLSFVLPIERGIITAVNPEGLREGILGQCVYMFSVIRHLDNS